MNVDACITRLRMEVVDKSAGRQGAAQGPRRRRRHRGRQQRPGGLRHPGRGAEERHQGRPLGRLARRRASRHPAGPTPGRQTAHPDRTSHREPRSRMEVIIVDRSAGRRPDRRRRLHPPADPHARRGPRPGDRLDAAGRLRRAHPPPPRGGPELRPGPGVPARRVRRPAGRPPRALPRLHRAGPHRPGRLRPRRGRRARRPRRGPRGRGPRLRRGDPRGRRHRHPDPRDRLRRPPGVQHADVEPDQPHPPEDAHAEDPGRTTRASSTTTSTRCPRTA